MLERPPKARIMGARASFGRAIFLTNPHREKADAAMVLSKSRAMR
jgi:hypothetical protein